MHADSTAEMEQGAALACARLLGLGDGLRAIARVSAGVAVAPGCIMSLGLLRVEALAVGVAAVALVGWAAAEWLAARVRLDVALFNDVAARRLAWESLDSVLGAVPRPLMLRIAGARRLLVRLAGTSVVLLGLAMLQLSMAALLR